MAIATLSVDIEARLARFEEGVNRANGLLDKLSRGATTASQRIGEFFAGAFGANVAAEAINRVIGLFPAVVGGVLAIKDLSEATGSSVENISALDDIARRAGGSFEQVEAALVKFNSALKEADGKNTVSQAIKALGLDAVKLREADPAEALLQTAQALEKFEDNGNRARLVQELFGKSVKEVGPFLRDLAEAGQLNAKVTSEQAEAVDKFDKNMARLKANSLDTHRAIVNALVPALNEFFDVFNGKGPGYLSSALTEPLRIAAIAGANVAYVMKGIGTEIGGIAAQAAALARLDFAGARVIGDAMRADAAAARADVDRLTQRLVLAGTIPQADYSNEGRNRIRQKPSLPSMLSPAGKDGKSFDSYDEAITRAIADLINKTDTVKFAELNAQFQRLQELAAVGLDPKIVEQVTQLLFPPQGNKVGPPISDELARVNELLLQTNSAKLAAAMRDVALLRDELSRVSPGSQRWLELTDAIIDAETEVSKLSGLLDEVVTETDQVAQQLRDTIEGTLGSSISSALRGNFDDIGKMWGNLLIDMAARALAADILGKLFGNAGGTQGGTGTQPVLDGLLKLFAGFGSAKGNAFGPAGLIPFASGGIVTGATPFAFGAGKLGLMGEAGPEAILPLKRGSDGRLGVSSDAGRRQASGPVITQVFHVNGDVSPGTVSLVQGMIDRSNARLLRDMRVGQMAGA